MAVDANRAVVASAFNSFLAEARRAAAPLQDSQGAVNADEALPPDIDQHAKGALKALEMADDMAAIAAQFRSRRELERKPAVASEGFDRVLDDEVEAKVLKLQQLSAVRELSMRSLLAQAKSLFPDPSDLFLVLAELCRRNQLPQAQRDKLGRLHQQVAHEANQRDLLGGIHCALKAKLFGNALEVKASLLRRSYRRFLSATRDPLDHYEDWIAAYGYQKRHVVLDFLQESLACDIRSADPSCSMIEFGDLLGHMKHLRLLRSADMEFVGGLTARRLVTTAEEEAYWILNLCTLLRPQDDASRVLAGMMHEGRVSSAAARAQWLNAVRAACKQLPDGLRGEAVSEILLLTLDDMAATYHAAERPTPGQPC